VIILLNGASSCGKSSIAKELQLVFDDLFLGMSVDKFMSMVPSTHQGLGAKAAPMWSWKKGFDDYGELMTLQVGPRGNSYILGMYECIGIMAERGFNIIVDDVCLDAELLKQIAAKLSQFKMYFIGVMCPLHILEKRERVRGNRVITSARGQHDSVHRFYEYDLMVDTSEASARDCALQIKTFVEKNPGPQALKRLCGLDDSDFKIK
jgi:chloramphenicol 3-O phosphotransferase